LWVIAFALVVDHPYFAVTDADEKFTIPNVPPGDYVISAIHRKASHLTPVRQRITVRPNDATCADFTLKVPDQAGQISSR